MAFSANLGGWIADTLVSKGWSVTTVRKVFLIAEKCIKWFNVLFAFLELLILCPKLRWCSQLVFSDLHFSYLNWVMSTLLRWLFFAWLVVRFVHNYCLILFHLTTTLLFWNKKKFIFTHEWTFAHMKQGSDAFSQSGLYSNHQDIAPRYSVSISILTHLWID